MCGRPPIQGEAFRLVERVDLQFLGVFDVQPCPGSEEKCIEKGRSYRNSLFDAFLSKFVLFSELRITLSV